MLVKHWGISLKAEKVPTAGLIAAAAVLIFAAWIYFPIVGVDSPYFWVGYIPVGLGLGAVVVSMVAVILRPRRSEEEVAAMWRHECRVREGSNPRTQGK